MPPVNSHPKQERLEARISPDVKVLLQRAAALEGRSVTDFVVASAQAAARATIERHTLVELSVRDCSSFVEALLSPEEPNDRLRAAANRHAGLIGE